VQLSFCVSKPTSIVESSIARSLLCVAYGSAVVALGETNDRADYSNICHSTGLDRSRSRQIGTDSVNTKSLHSLIKLACRCYHHDHKIADVKCHLQNIYHFCGNFLFVIIMSVFEVFFV